MKRKRIVAAVVTACSVVSAGAISAPAAVVFQGADEIQESSVPEVTDPSEIEAEPPIGLEADDVYEEKPDEEQEDAEEPRGRVEATDPDGGRLYPGSEGDEAADSTEERQICGAEENEDDAPEASVSDPSPAENENGNLEKTALYLSLQPVKKYGEKDPDLAEMIREQLHAQLNDREKERLAEGYLHIRYVGDFSDEGQSREPGQSEIEVKMEENPYWILEGDDGDAESYLITIPSDTANREYRENNADGDEGTSGESAGESSYAPEKEAAEDTSVEESSVEDRSSGQESMDVSPDGYPENLLCNGPDPENIDDPYSSRKVYTDDSKGSQESKTVKASQEAGKASAAREQGAVTADTDAGNKTAKAETKTAVNCAKLTLIPGIRDGNVYRGNVSTVIRTVNEADNDCVVKLTRNGRWHGDEDVTDLFLRNRKKDGSTETVLEDPSRTRENDGTYTLSVKYRDQEGKEAEKKVQFALNRFGSVYEFGDKLQHLDGASVKKIGQGLRLSEYNPGSLVKDSCRLEITRDGHPVKTEGFSVRDMGIVRATSADGHKGWHRYDYVISKKNFRKEGIYQLVISSRDGSGNEQDSLRAGQRCVSFCVDRTAPVIESVAGLENRNLEEESKVRVEVSDAMGLRNIRIYADGQLIREEKNFEKGNSCKTEFVLKGGEHHIRITATDQAGNRIDTDEKAADGSYTFCPDYPFERQVSVGKTKEAENVEGTKGFWGSLWKMMSDIPAHVHKWLTS